MSTKIVERDILITIVQQLEDIFSIVCTNLWVCVNTVNWVSGAQTTSMRNNVSWWVILCYVTCDEPFTRKVKYTYMSGNMWGTTLYKHRIYCHLISFCTDTPPPPPIPNPRSHQQMYKHKRMLKLVRKLVLFCSNVK